MCHALNQNVKAFRLLEINRGSRDGALLYRDARAMQAQKWPALQGYMGGWHFTNIKMEHEQACTKGDGRMGDYIQLGILN